MTPSHIAAEKCEMMKSNNKQCLTTTAACDGKSLPPESGFPSSSFPVDPDFCVKIPFQLLTFVLTSVKRNSNPTQNLKTFTFNLMTKYLNLSDLLKDSSIC